MVGDSPLLGSGDLTSAAASNRPRRDSWAAVALLAIMLAGLVFHLWGLRRDLPYAPDADEPLFIRPAVTMAATLDLNPHWFGNPGSTVIYPLAVLVKLAHNAPAQLLRPDPSLQAAFDANPGDFYLLGRLLTVAYAMLSLPVIFLVGRLVFGAPVGLAAAWLLLCYPFVVTHAQRLRTDSAGVFWTMLAIYLCLRLYRQPSVKRQALAGLAIGLATSTRYFMVTLLALLLAVDWLLWREGRKLTPRAFATGFAAALAGFALTSPYFFLDFQQALAALRLENRAAHLGADGLSPVGNLRWYVTVAIPRAMTTAQAALAAAGAGIVLRRRHTPGRLLVFYVAVFLLAISVSRLHWQRWLIQILPLLALLTAYAVHTLIAWPRRPLSKAWRQGIFVAAILLLSARPAYETLQNAALNARPSTLIEARAWIVANLPAGSRIALEEYTAPLGGTTMQTSWRFSAGADATLADYYAEGAQYVMVSSQLYDRYFAEPERYAREVAFYRELFERERLVRSFAPSDQQRGPEIRIYALE